MSEIVDTADAILSYAADQLTETDFDDIAYRDIGRNVGISERTVYRHFPTRSHLLAELGLWLERQYLASEAFTTWEGLFKAVESRFRSFEALPSAAFILARAASISPVGQHQGSFFASSVEALVLETTPGLNSRDRLRAVSSLCYFASAQYWVRCRTAFGLGVEDIIVSFRQLAKEVLSSAPEGTWPPAALLQEAW